MYNLSDTIHLDKRKQAIDTVTHIKYQPILTYCVLLPIYFQQICKYDCVSCSPCQDFCDIFLFLFFHLFSGLVRFLVMLYGICTMYRELQHVYAFELKIKIKIIWIMLQIWSYNKLSVGQVGLCHWVVFTSVYNYLTGINQDIFISSHLLGFIVFLYCSLISSHTPKGPEIWSAMVSIQPSAWLHNFLQATSSQTPTCLEIWYCACRLNAWMKCIPF